MLKYYVANKITAFDIHSSYEEKLMQAAQESKADLSLVIADRISEAGFSKNEFDTAFSISVFLHIRPENVVEDLCVLLDCSRKVVGVSYFCENSPKHPVGLGPEDNTYCFNYDYISLAALCGAKINVIHKDVEKRQICFIMER